MQTMRPKCAPRVEGKPAPLTVEEAVAELRAAGFTPGTPAHVSPYSRAVDASACRKLLCGYCGKRRLGYLPFRNENRYRALAVCPVCSRASEV